MARRLKLAGLGLCAFMFPACAGSSGPTNPYYTTGGGTGPIVMYPNQNSGIYRTAPTYAVPSAPSASSDRFGPITQANPAPAPSNNIAQFAPANATPAAPASDVIGPILPPPSPLAPPTPLNPAVTADQPARIVAPTPTTPPPKSNAFAGWPGQPAPPAPTIRPIDAPPTGVVPASASKSAVATEEIRYPQWPNPGGSASAPAPMNTPEALPKLEPVVPVVMPDSSKFLPPIEHGPSQGTATSMKVTAASTVSASDSPSVVLPPATTNESLLVRSIRAFQANRPEEALELLKQIDSSNQELLMYMVPIMVKLGDGRLNSMAPEELALMIDQLQTASSLLKSKAALRADHVCFCRGVRKFAEFDPYEPNHEFHCRETVYLYAELKNFTWEPVVVPARAGTAGAGQRNYAIRVSTTLELRDARNNLVWRTDLAKNDVAHMPQQDYYHTYRFSVPDKLPPGVYSLWMHITDKPTNRVLHQRIDMRVSQN